MKTPTRSAAVVRTVARATRKALIPAVAVASVVGLTTGVAVGLAPRLTTSESAASTPVQKILGPRTDAAGADRPTPTPTPTATAPAPAAVGSGLALPRERWWGGPAYYAKFSKAAAAGWTKDTFFPIAVFYGKPEHASALASIGVNTYMGAEHDGSPISSITGTGISVIAQEEWTEAELGNDPRVVGWHISDECDQGEGDCWQGGDENARVAKQKGYADEARANDDGRFVQANFGNGVLGTYWATNTMAQHVALTDVTSVDKYAYTSPGVDDVITGSSTWPKGADPDSAATYGWLQDRMETYSSPAGSKPDWVFVETSKPFLNEDGARVITNQQIGGAVWSAIIHGAAGISYFQHSNSGCGTYSLVQCSASLRASVRQLDAEVTSLAPVINTQSYVWDFGSGLDTSLKTKDGSAYVFAMAQGAPGSRTFTLPPGVRGASVEVVGENRTLPVSGGRFTDSFAAEYSHHVYRIALAG